MRKVFILTDGFSKRINDRLVKPLNIITHPCPKFNSSLVRPLLEFVRTWMSNYIPHKTMWFCFNITYPCTKPIWSVSVKGSLTTWSNRGLFRLLMHQWGSCLYAKCSCVQIESQWPERFNHSAAETGIFQEKYVDTMAVDTLAPCVARTIQLWHCLCPINVPFTIHWKNYHYMYISF